MLPTREEIYTSLAKRHGEAFQKKMELASVVVCGLGGLGSNIAIMLARAGIGKLTLIDFDKVDLSNVNRQQYLLSQIGMDKTQALKELLVQINPYTEVVTHTVRLNEGNIKEYLGKETYICEALDRAESKAMLVNTVLENFPEKFIVSGSGMAGIAPANEIVTKKITSHFYLCGDGKNDVTECGSLVSARVMVCAAHQANALMHLILGQSPV